MSDRSDYFPTRESRCLSQSLRVPIMREPPLWAYLDQSQNWTAVSTNDVTISPADLSLSLSLSLSGSIIRIIIHSIVSFAMVI